MWWVGVAQLIHYENYMDLQGDVQREYQAMSGMFRSCVELHEAA